MKEKFIFRVMGPYFKHIENVHPYKQKEVFEMLGYLKENADITKIYLYGLSITPVCLKDTPLELYVELGRNVFLNVHRYFNFAYTILTNYDTDPKTKEEIYENGLCLYKRKVF